MSASLRICVPGRRRTPAQTDVGQRRARGVVVAPLLAVTRSLIVTDDAVWIQTISEGTGYMRTFNGVLGPVPFIQLDMTIRNRFIGPPTD